jgi:hypothetical protein
MIPTISMQQNIPTDPAIISGLRPTLSIKRIAGTVTATLIIPTTPVASNEIVLLVKPSVPKMIAA